MKKYVIYIACLLAMLWGCNSKQKADNHTEQNKESHAGHNHSEEEGVHSHAEGEECDHDHAEGEDSHDKEAHGEEIVFSPEQAKKAGLEIVNVQPSAFHQVIKTSGQILSAQGDEVTISATASGMVSFNKASLNEGLAVRGGESLLSISSKNIVDGDPVAKAKSAYEIA